MRVFSSDPVVVFDDEMQSTNDGLTRRVWLCSGGGRKSDVAARIAEKWWREHLSDFDVVLLEHLVSISGVKT